MADKDRKSIGIHKQEADYRKMIAELLEAFERKWGLG